MTLSDGYHLFRLEGPIPIGRIDRFPVPRSRPIDRPRDDGTMGAGPVSTRWVCPQPRGQTLEPAFPVFCLMTNMVFSCFWSKREEWRQDVASGGETWRVEASGGEERFDQGDEVFEIGQQELQGLATARRIWKGWAAGMVFVLKTEMYSHFFFVTTSW